MANAKRAADEKVAEDARIANRHRIVAEMAEVRKLRSKYSLTTP